MQLKGQGPISTGATNDSTRSTRIPNTKAPRRGAMTAAVLTFPSADLMRVVRATDELDTEGVAAGVRVGGGAGLELGEVEVAAEAVALGPEAGDGDDGALESEVARV